MRSFHGLWATSFLHKYSQILLSTNDYTLKSFLLYFLPFHKILDPPIEILMKRKTDSWSLCLLPKLSVQLNALFESDIKSYLLNFPLEYTDPKWHPIITLSQNPVTTSVFFWTPLSYVNSQRKSKDYISSQNMRFYWEVVPSKDSYRQLWLIIMDCSPGCSFMMAGKLEC